MSSAALFNRQRRSWRAQPKDRRLKPPHFFRVTIPTDLLRGWSLPDDFPDDGPLGAGVTSVGPIEITGVWDTGSDDSGVSFGAVFAGGRLPRRTKKALRKWTVYDYIGPREGARLRNVHMIATPLSPATT